MPANLTQQYLKAEKEYRAATTLDEELACLQVMLREIPKHKGTDHLQAQLKSKISKAKKELQSGKRAGKKTRGIRIPRQGAGTAILLGGILEQKGIHLDDILQSSLITPACGLGSLTEELAEEVLSLTTGVAQAMRERYA